MKKYRLNNPESFPTIRLTQTVALSLCKKNISKTFEAKSEIEAESVNAIMHF